MRLNNDKRAILLEHARKLIEESEDIKEKQTQVETLLHKVKATSKFLAKTTVDPDEIEVLEKYGQVDRYGTGITKTNRYGGTIWLPQIVLWQHPGADITKNYGNLDYYERQNYKTYVVDIDRTGQGRDEVVLPSSWGGYIPVRASHLFWNDLEEYLALNQELWKLKNEKLATFDKLLNTARTLAQVVEVWPAAADVELPEAPKRTRRKIDKPADILSDAELKKIMDI